MRASVVTTTLVGDQDRRGRSAAVKHGTVAATHGAAAGALAHWAHWAPTPARC